MLIYYVLLVVVTALAYAAQTTKSKSLAHLCVGGVFVLLVFVAGFRAESVGTDTGEYVRGFVWHVTFLDYWEGSSIEPGYRVIKYLSGLISHDYWALLVLIAVITVFCHMWSIYKFSVNPVIALFVFITMGYYTFFFNGARQGLAIAIYSLAVWSLLEGNFRKYASLVGLAFLFHRSVIIALPLYFFFRQDFSKYIILLSILAAIMLASFQGVLNLGTIVSAKYVIYGQMQARGGQWLTFFNVLLSILFIFFRKFVLPADKKAYDCLLNMFIFGTTVYVVVIFSGAYVEIMRIANFFLLASIFLWPLVFRNIRLPLDRYLLGVGFALGCFLVFYIFLDKMANLTPYKFNEVLLAWLS